MRDALVLSASIASRRAFERVDRWVDPGEFTPMGAYWWRYVADWYKGDPDATAVDREVLRERGLRSCNPKQRETMEAWLDELPEPVSPNNIATELLELKRIAKGNELAAAQHSGEPMAKLAKLAEEHLQLLKATELGMSKVRRTMNVNEMESKLSDANRIPLAPQKLQDRTGGAVPGDHIVIFGRPEAGKSCFAINMAAGFIKSGRRVLYIGNEESTDKTLARIICNLARCTEEARRRQPERALARAGERGLRVLENGDLDPEGLLHIYHMEPGSVPEIEELVEQVKPEVVVIDQFLNLESAGDKPAQKMEQNAKDLRAMLARHDVVGVSVTQAGDRTERHGQSVPAWLGMGDVYGSRTGLPAQADLMIGVGFDDDMERAGQRAVSLPKNKLGGTHDGFTVNVDFARSTMR
jgi:KaiC/GvpD/RAD55 family RecA-like ATPase